MNWAEVASLAQLASTMAMLGVIWVVQLCVYPRFEDIEPQKFLGAHLRHCRGIGLVVIPFMVTELISAGFLVWRGWAGSEQWVVLALTFGTWLSTALVQAPCHRKLMLGFEPSLCRSLTRGNWLRTGLWTLKAILVSVLSIKMLKL